MNLSTTYMGFELAHPLVPGASPMVDDLDLVRRLEDAGAAMIVMHSLFEEQIVAEEVALTRAIETGDEFYPLFFVSPYRAHIRSAHARLRPQRRLRGIFLIGAATPPCPRRGVCRLICFHSST